MLWMRLCLYVIIINILIIRHSCAFNCTLYAITFVHCIQLYTIQDDPAKLYSNDHESTAPICQTQYLTEDTEYWILSVSIFKNCFNIYMPITLNCSVDQLMKSTLQTLTALQGKPLMTFSCETSLLYTRLQCTTEHIRSQQNKHVFSHFSIKI